MSHTQIHRRVKAGTTWLCLSWKLRFRMEHMFTSLYYRLRTDHSRRSLRQKILQIHPGKPVPGFSTIIHPCYLLSNVSFFFFFFLSDFDSYSSRRVLVRRCFLVKIKKIRNACLQSFCVIIVACMNTNKLLFHGGRWASHFIYILRLVFEYT